LLDSGPVELSIASLELHDEHDRANEEHCVHPSAHPRDVELQEERATQAAQMTFQQSNRRQPGLPVSRKNWKIALPCQVAEDGVRFLPKEFSDRGIKPCSGEDGRANWRCCRFHVVTVMSSRRSGRKQNVVRAPFECIADLVDVTGRPPRRFPRSWLTSASSRRWVIYSRSSSSASTEWVTCRPRSRSFWRRGCRAIPTRPPARA